MIDTKKNKQIISWNKVDNSTLRQLEIPKGEYSRKDFYNENNYDLEIEIFANII